MSHILLEMKPGSLIVLVITSNSERKTLSKKCHQMHHEKHHAKKLTLSHVAVASHGALLAGGLRRAPRGQAHLRVRNI